MSIAVHSETTTHHASSSATDHEHEHHEQHFITKYIFSQDHKIIAKQFLITGIIWAVIENCFAIIL